MLSRGDHLGTCVCPQAVVASSSAPCWPPSPPASSTQGHLVSPVPLPLLPSHLSPSPRPRLPLAIAWLLSTQGRQLAGQLPVASGTWWPVRPRYPGGYQPGPPPRAVCPVLLHSRAWDSLSDYSYGVVPDALGAEKSPCRNRLTGVSLWPGGALPGGWGHDLGWRRQMRGCPLSETLQ